MSCPTSQVLLDYHRSLLIPADQVFVERHLVICDFCSAELQLLTRYRSEAEEYSFAEMPAQIRQLAEGLLKRGMIPLPGFADFAENPQVSH
jgi:hypothetical protein